VTALGVALGVLGLVVGFAFAWVPGQLRRRWRLRRWRRAVAQRTSKPAPRRVPSLPPVPDDLGRALETGRCVLVAGAGLSKQAGLPSWPELLKLIIAEGRRTDPSGEWDRLDQLLATGRHDLLADRLLAVLGPPGVRDAVARILDAHRAPFAERRLSALRGRLTAVVTDHWDDGLERALDAKVLTPARVGAGSDLLRAGKPFVLKLYGSLDGDDFSFTDDELRDKVESSHDFRELIGGLLSTRMLMFVGMSPTGIEHFCRWSGMRPPGRHYALVPERPETVFEEDRLLDRYGLKFLSFEPDEEYTTVPAFLGDLAQRARPHRGRDRKAVSHLSEVTLENIGPFEHLQLDLNAARTVLLGDNASGKTSVLRAIALGLCGESPATVFAPARLLRSGAQTGSIVLRFGDETYRTDLRRYRDQVLVEAKAVTPVQAGEWLAIGFPALRGASTADPRAATVAPGRPPGPADLLPLLGGAVDVRVDDVKQWVFTQALQRRNRFRPTAGGLDAFFEVLRALSPGVQFDFDDVDEATGAIYLTTPDGRITLDMLSQGMSSVLGWIGVLLQRLFEVNPEHSSPAEGSVLVLVDEIDAHLHPAWQRQLLRLLGQTFPGMQLIATTHSPLIVGNAQPGELVQLTQRDAIPIQSSLRGLRADQILTSEAFDLSSTRDTETAAAIDAYRRLLRQPQTAAVNAEAEERLKDLLERLPEPEDTPEQRQAANLVSRWVRERALAEFEAMPPDRRAQVEAEMRAYAARLAKEERQ